MKQRQALITAVGGPEKVRVVEDEIPEPGPGEVRVKVLATGVAFADVRMRHGEYPGAPEMPFTPGYDLAGVVDELGEGVSSVETGQNVVALTEHGAHARYACLPAEEAVPIPEGVDPVEAACLPLNYVTAFQMLYRVARVQPGERVLIHGAAGGVGTAMLQLGRLSGGEMYGTASRPKHELVAAHGAIPIDYKNEDFVEKVHELTGSGVEAVFDPIGGDHVARSFRTLRRGGRLVVYGFSSPEGGSLARSLARQIARMVLWSALPNGKKATMYAIARVKRQHPDWFREDLSRLLGLLAEGKISPIVAERLPLEEISHAHDLLENAGVQGKLVLLPNDSGGPA